jgi:hypothetical protein
MDGKILDSEGQYVADIRANQIYDLSGKKLYDLRGQKIYKPTGPTDCSQKFSPAGRLKAKGK